MAVERIAPTRIADTIVEKLETMILEGTLQPGERLPAERVLAERFGVSRPSLREAVQKLGANGLLVSRHGGGNYVSESLGSSFSDPLITLLRNRASAQSDLLEFRRTVEADCAYYAALRATEPDLAHIRKAYEALQACYAECDETSLKEEGEADAGFHLAIAEASHNAILLHTIRGIFSLLQVNVVTNIGGMYAKDAETQSQLMAQHRRLFEAIVERRAEDARECAGQHIEYVASVLGEQNETYERLERSRRREQLAQT
ncbi:GntR family transcriptional regulator [Tamilnaduibacter salinus]|uniref:Pyruvate dehydrogenase complex repressor n=1 Tax=Tamilnaduibacter salinus TaxID=1484056 RepID=A0A2A2I2H4_9GAMM|nr:FCD domain-containing protein [Tamilnaduibacter salinus]PAV25290.1 transcriptional regulator PdhR [Tamilnaduibacter salinus]PVY77014.1 GntR family transcriptional regulator [Tamilnaduibacter salinus]